MKDCGWIRKHWHEYGREIQKKKVCQLITLILSTYFVLKHYHHTQFRVSLSEQGEEGKKKTFGHSLDSFIDVSSYWQK